jgi:hypothetical protein
MPDAPDLFKEPKIDALKRWMKERRCFSTHDVIQYATNYYSSANRRKQELCEAGVIRVASDFERYSYGYRGKDEAYVWVGE